MASSYWKAHNNIISRYRKNIEIEKKNSSNNLFIIILFES